ncbi:hypothetical protein GOV12_05035 [Candidatus Pacearchaeota archaeon]|nr:hypothetical protein [Candidatus Pacearchaeota archaeon]
MKIVRLKKGVKSKVTRKFVSRVGEMIYHSPDVRSIFVKVDFKDGSSISYRRDEDEDTFDSIIDEEIKET